MKQHPTKRNLSPVERALGERLQANAEPERPLQWQDLAGKLGPAHAVKRKRRWTVWLTPVAVAAAVAWLVVVQPNTSSPAVHEPQPMLLAGNYSLDAIDKQLQNAYLEGADAAEIDALWQRRETLTAQETSS